MPGLFGPSGGILYHLRARRNRRLWRPFTTDLSHWLGEWECPSDKLVLIGPSAGYSLPHRWLKQFAQIDAYDVDPLAGFFFRRQHPSIQARFHRTDVFWKNGKLDIQLLQRVLQNHPGATVLFTNVLGQLLLEKTASEEQWLEYLLSLRQTLNGRAWASYHDVLTEEDGEAIDHLTGGEWKAGLSCRRFRWQLTPNSIHWIEGIRSDC